MFCKKYGKTVLFLGRNNLKSKNFELTKKKFYFTNLTIKKKSLIYNFLIKQIIKI